MAVASPSARRWMEVEFIPSQRLAVSRACWRRADRTRDSRPMASTSRTGLAKSMPAVGQELCYAGLRRHAAAALPTASRLALSGLGAGFTAHSVAGLVQSQSSAGRRRRMVGGVSGWVRSRKHGRAATVSRAGPGSAHLCRVLVRRLPGLLRSRQGQCEPVADPLGTRALDAARRSTAPDLRHRL